MRESNYTATIETGNNLVVADLVFEVLDDRTTFGSRITTMGVICLSSSSSGTTCSSSSSTCIVYPDDEAPDEEPDAH